MTSHCLICNGTFFGFRITNEYFSVDRPNSSPSAKGLAPLPSISTWCLFFPILKTSTGIFVMPFRGYKKYHHSCFPPVFSALNSNLGFCTPSIVFFFLPKVFIMPKTCRGNRVTTMTVETLRLSFLFFTYVAGDSQTECNKKRCSKFLESDGYPRIFGPCVGACLAHRQRWFSNICANAIAGD